MEMGIFDFFRRLSFFKGRDTEGMTEEDLDFDKWIQAHRDWRQRLVSFIGGNSAEVLEPEIICRDDRCALGQWIHGHGGKFYGDLEVFVRLRENHLQFHQSAGKVVSCFKAEGAVAATRMLNRDFDQHSLRVIGDLQSLERLVRD